MACKQPNKTIVECNGTPVFHRKKNMQQAHTGSIRELWSLHPLGCDCVIDLEAPFQDHSGFTPTID